MNKIPLSVLVIFKHQDELFFIVRQNHLKVFPGYCSFPGGKVDRHERELHHGEIPPKLFGAAVREISEELRFHLVPSLKNGVVQNIRHIGQAITPDFNPYRFEAQYLLAELSEKPEFTLDKNEIREGFWATPDKMRASFEKGDLIVIPPMWKILNYIENGHVEKESFDLATPEGQVPCLESIFGVRQFMPLSNTLPPAERTNAFLIGDTLVDPSPRDEDEFGKLLMSLPENSVKKVFITHHHGDHHNLAKDVALKLDARILLSEYTLERILELKGENYYQGVKIDIVGDGEVVTTWLGEDVVVHAIPGHDEGHLALAPQSLKWFIAGDLFQGIGTVVIGGREGNMKKYFSTLERVISLAPRAVYPSHGIALGGVGILEKTLRHRKLREDQIFEMAKEGLSQEQMLARVYFDLPRPLHKYALANINSHIEKLKEDGLL